MNTPQHDEKPTGDLQTPLVFDPLDLAPPPPGSSVPDNLLKEEAGNRDIALTLPLDEMIEQGFGENDRISLLVNDASVNSIKLDPNHIEKRVVEFTLAFQDRPRNAMSRINYRVQSGSTGFNGPLNQSFRTDFDAPGAGQLPRLEFSPDVIDDGVTVEDLIGTGADAWLEATVPAYFDQAAGDEIVPFVSLPDGSSRHDLPRHVITTAETGRPITLGFPRDVLASFGDRTAVFGYVATDRAGNASADSVGQSLELRLSELLAPRIVGSEGPVIDSLHNPAIDSKGLPVTITSDDLTTDDYVIVTLSGPGASHSAAFLVPDTGRSSSRSHMAITRRDGTTLTVAPLIASATGEFTTPPIFGEQIARNVGQKVQLQYKALNKFDDSNERTSLIAPYDILPVASADARVKRPFFTDAQDGFIDPERLTEDARITVPLWPHGNWFSRYWLTASTRDSSFTIARAADAPAGTSFSARLDLDWLKILPQPSAVTLDLKVLFGPSTGDDDLDESRAASFRSDGTVVDRITEDTLPLPDIAEAANGVIDSSLTELTFTVPAIGKVTDLDTLVAYVNEQAIDSIAAAPGEAYRLAFKPSYLGEPASLKLKYVVRFSNGSSLTSQDVVLAVRWFDTVPFAAPSVQEAQGDTLDAGRMQASLVIPASNEMKEGDIIQAWAGETSLGTQLGSRGTERTFTVDRQALDALPDRATFAYAVWRNASLSSRAETSYRIFRTPDLLAPEFPDAAEGTLDMAQTVYTVRIDGTGLIPGDEIIVFSDGKPRAQALYYADLIVYFDKDSTWTNAGDVVETYYRITRKDVAGSHAWTSPTRRMSLGWLSRSFTAKHLSLYEHLFAEEGVPLPDSRGKLFADVYSSGITSTGRILMQANGSESLYFFDVGTTWIIFDLEGLSKSVQLNLTVNTDTRDAQVLEFLFWNENGGQLDRVKHVHESGKTVNYGFIGEKDWRFSQCAFRATTEAVGGTKIAVNRIRLYERYPASTRIDTGDNEEIGMDVSPRNDTPTFEAPTIKEASGNALDGDLARMTLVVPKSSERKEGDTLQVLIGDVRGEAVSWTAPDQQEITFDLPPGLSDAPELTAGYVVTRFTLPGSRAPASGERGLFFEYFSKERTYELSHFQSATFAAPSVPEVVNGMLNASIGVATLAIPASAAFASGDQVEAYANDRSLGSVAIQSGSAPKFTIGRTILDSGAKELKVSYDVIRGGQRRASGIATVKIIRDAVLSAPAIPEASASGLLDPEAAASVRVSLDSSVVAGATIEAFFNNTSLGSQTRGSSSSQTLSFPVPAATLSASGGTSVGVRYTVVQNNLTYQSPVLQARTGKWDQWLDMRTYKDIIEGPGVQAAETNLMIIRTQDIGIPAGSFLDVHPYPPVSSSILYCGITLLQTGNTLTRIDMKTEAPVSFVLSRIIKKPLVSLSIAVKFKDAKGNDVGSGTISGRDIANQYSEFRMSCLAPVKTVEIEAHHAIWGMLSLGAMSKA